MIEFPTIPSEATYKKDLNDCTVGDLELGSARQGVVGSPQSHNGGCRRREGR